jgi:hypothetical protein
VINRRHGLQLSLIGLACGLLAAFAFADESCRVAFDMGSSGIRAGYTGSVVTTRAGIDYLDPLWAGHGLETVVVPTIRALRNLPEQGRFPEGCSRVGGGFSAWRLALQQDPKELAAILARIETASNVAVLVIPQLQEGAYGYYGARQLLGDRLSTSHVLDIGGGSLQIAGEHTAYGEMLGQKVWHQQLCQEIRHADSSCVLQPMTGKELAVARTLLAKKLAGVSTALPESITMTAISRPVSRGVLPVVNRLVPESFGPNGLQRSAITAAIARIAGLTREETTELIGGTQANVSYLLSSMLLVEGVLLATGAESLQVAEIDLTNLPGLLADDHAFAWRQQYDCYLGRLQTLGIDAYASDPATCP